MVVTDGFTGNVALKVMEGTSKTVRDAIRDAIRSGPVSSAGGLLIRGAVGRLRDELDPERVGRRDPAGPAHGRWWWPTAASAREGIANAVGLARRAVDERMVERTHEALEAAGALRSAPAASFAPE